MSRSTSWLGSLVAAGLAAATVLAVSPAAAADDQVVVDVLRLVDGAYVVETSTVPGRDAEAAADALAAAPDVVAASPQVLYRIDGTPDPRWSADDPQVASRVRDVWPRTRGAGQLVAVLDTAATLDHEDLSGAVVPGTDVVGGTSDPSHGTGVAGVIAARADNGLGSAGMAPESRVVPVRVCNDGGCPSAAVARGILWATDHGADVINMSLSGAGYSDVQAFAVQYALDRGVSVVASTGNSGLEGNPVSYPAALDGVVAVSATTPTGAPADWAVHGWQADVATVGEGVLLTLPGNAYGDGSGTSFSGPAVAGAVALLRAGQPGITPRQVQAALQAGADSTGGWDRAWGAGRLDLPAAFTAAARTGPAVTLTPSSGRVDVGWSAVPGASSYTVRVDGVVRATVPGTSTTVTALTDGTQVAVDVQPDTGARGPAALTTVGPVVAAVPVLQSAALSGTASSAVLALTASTPGAVAPRYSLVRDGVSIGTLPLALTATSRTFSINIGAMPAHESRWQLRGLDDLGRVTAASNAVLAGSGRPAAPASPPTGLTGRADGDRALLTWDDLGGAYTYRVTLAGAVVATPVTAGAALTAPRGASRTYAVAVVDAWGQAGPTATVTVTLPPGPSPSAITLAWQASGAESGPLGAATGTETCGLRDGGCFRSFTGGTVYWSPATGARTVTGTTYGRWAAQGWEGGALGYPVTDTTCGLLDGGCYQHFQGGTVMSSPATGAWALSGALREGWFRTGSETGSLGYPTGAGVCGLRAGGCFQPFARGSLYWSPPTGARVVTWPAGDAWARQGWEGGALGYPVTDTTCGLARSGCYQHFQGGTVMYSPASGSQAVSGPLRDGWFRSGSEAGVLGYPTSGALCGLRDGGCLQRFETGTLYWSPATGAHPVTGAVADAWARQGWEGGPLGYPVTAAGCGLRDGGCYQHFQGGTVMSSPAGGAWAVSGPLREGWFRTGSEAGPLGYPAAAAVCGLQGGGCFQRFGGGALYWSPATGAQPVLPGAIGDRWAALGWEGGLGYPVDAEREVTGGRAQRFQAGTLTWVRATGEVRRS